MKRKTKNLFFLIILFVFLGFLGKSVNSFELTFELSSGLVNSKITNNFKEEIKIEKEIGIEPATQFISPSLPTNTSSKQSEEETPPSQPLVFTFREGDLIKIKAEAIDLDKDKVFLYYYPPLNESGEWQTTLEDAGSYVTKIVASDGLSQTEKKIVLIIENKNQPPQIKEKKIVAEETDTIDLKKLIFDPDGDPLEMVFQKPFNEEGLWSTTYEDAGSYKTKIKISDSQYSVTKEIEIEIKNKNQPPEIISLFAEEGNLSFLENSSFYFSVIAKDKDGDSLTYSWQLDGKEISSKPSFKYFFDFDSAGEHILRLLISDQKSEIKKKWFLQIKNLNRPPKIEHPPVIVDEGEKIILQLPKKDEDGDLLQYSFSPPFNQEGIWQTTYRDSGTYKVLVTAFDGNLSTQKEILVTVREVDRPPIIDLPSKIILKEGELWELNLTKKIFDPDEDELVFTIENLPPGADFKKGIIRWKPSYNLIQKKRTFLINLLSKLGIEKHFFPHNKKINLLVGACGKQLCAEHPLELFVENVNRPPVLEKLGPIVIEEGESFQLKPNASDADGDDLRYYFKLPFDSQGKWTPSYEEAGEYETEVVVSDGDLTDKQKIKILVLNKNQPPILKIKKNKYQINEEEALSFQVEAKDPDGDNLTIYAKGLPPGASFQDKTFSWIPPLETVTKREPSLLSSLYAYFPTLNRKFNKEDKQFLIDFIASDGEFDTTSTVVLIVKNVNQPPQIINYAPAPEKTIPLHEPLIFSVEAQDPDGDNLTYTWSFGFWDREVKGSSKIKRIFKTPGWKTVKVKVSDGASAVVKKWRIKVTQKPKQEYLASPPNTSSTQPLLSPSQFKVYVIEKEE